MTMMTPANAVRAVMKSNGFTQQKLATTMGYKDRAIVCNRLHKKDMRLSSFLQMMVGMGYKVSVQPLEQPLSDGEIVVSYSNSGM